MHPDLVQDVKLNVAHDLSTQGYSLIAANDITPAAQYPSQMAALLAEYPTLPQDEFLPNGARYRFRRYGRFYFSPLDDELLPLPHVDYMQTKDINPLVGGIVRKFAPLTPQLVDNAFLHALIRFDFAQFPITAEQQRGAWQVDVHLIRIVAGDEAAGEPTPEGIHRDGAQFVTVHLAELENAEGGVATIYDEDRQPLQSFTLGSIMEAYFVNDERVLHGVTPIRPRVTGQQAVRSILTFDYHFKPDLERP